MFECYEDFEDFISKRLTALREEKNISARDMSLSMGFAAGYVNHIENKITMPSMKGLYYICDALKITPKDFFDEGTESPELLTALINECKGMDRASLQALLTFVQNTKR